MQATITVRRMALVATAAAAFILGVYAGAHAINDEVTMKEPVGTVHVLSRGGVLMAYLTGDTPSVIPPCEDEDDASLCLWDAQRQGNGQGLSFVHVSDDVYLYVPSAS